MASDNYVENRGYGEWVITTYKPEKEFGPYSGYMVVSRDSHVIFKNYDNLNSNLSECISSFPSPNVAAAENKRK